MFKFLWALLKRFIPGLGSPYLLAGVALAAFMAGGWVVNKYVKAAEVSGLRTQIRTMQADSERRNKILVKREQARVEAQQDAQRWEQRWRRRLKTDETCKAWADSRLPDCVVSQLFRNASQDPKDIP